MSSPTNQSALLASQAADLLAAGRIDVAERLLKEALRAEPANPDALLLMGTLLGMRGQLPEAVKHLRRAVRAAPKSDAAHYNLGQALIRMGRFADAAESLRTASTLADLPHIHEKLGDCLRQLGRLDEAAHHFTRAVDLDPSSSLALSSAVEMLRKLCDWPRLDELQRRLIEAADAGKAVEPLLMLHVADDPRLQRKAAEAYWRELIVPAGVTKPAARKQDQAKLRIGYLSADFRQHPMVSVIAEAIELHDRGRFEAWGLSYGLDDGSPQRKRMERAFDRFVDMRALSDHQIAARIAQSGIDILVDLGGYTANARLGVVAARPAPIVCHYMGFPGTLGSPAYDYLIADPVVAPPGSEGNYSEALARLSTCYWTLDRKRTPPVAAASRAEHGLPDDAFVLSSFNGQQKLSPVLLDCWSRIMAAVPKAVLWIYSDHSTAARNIQREAVARGIGSDRLVMAGRVPPDKHLARIALADLMLDALPYGGHTTVCDALWMGVPALSVEGRTFVSRVGASLLTYAGLPELVVPSLAEYERLAIALALDRDRLADIRSRLVSSRNTASLFAIERFTRNLEAAYAQMWRRWSAGEQPASFDVAGV